MNLIGRDYINYLCAQIAIFGVPIILLPLLTRSLSTTDYGLIGLFNSFTQSVSLIGSISLAGAVARAYLDREGGIEFPLYLGNSIIVNLVLTSFATCLFGFSFGIIYETSFPTIFIALALVLVISTCVKEILLSLWNVMGFSKGYAFLVISVAILNVVSCGILLSIWSDWTARIFPLVLFEALCAIFSLVYLNKKFGVILRKEVSYLFDLLKFGVPLIPHSLGLLFITAADKFIVSMIFGLEELGVYSVASAGVALVSLVLLPLDKALTPTIYDRLYAGTLTAKIFLGWSVSYFAITNAVAFLVFIALSIAIPIIVGPMFQAAIDMVGVLVIGQIWFAMYRFWVKVIFFTKKTWQVSISTCVGGMLGCLVQYYGGLESGIGFFLWGVVFGFFGSACLVAVFAFKSLVCDESISSDCGNV